MGFKLSVNTFNEALKEITKDYKIYAPKTFEGMGAFSDTDVIRYGEITDINEVVFEQKSSFSFKEVIMPITQTLFYFTEDKWQEPKIDAKDILVLLRSCDLHAVKRMDEIYLNNGAIDPYYKALRDKTKFILMGCEHSFDNCFCVSMGTNTTDEHDAYIKKDEDYVYFDAKNSGLVSYFTHKEKEVVELEPEFVTQNEVKVKIPDNLNQDIMNSKMWEEYSGRCIACGRCNFVCPTCTCFSMQDIFYKDNPNAGERRRVWASCQVDGYTDIAGGMQFRKTKGERMRFKVLHKVYDYKKRFGYHMCVGCGRCDDICPEYISFSNCINKLENGMKEVASNER
ncbi:anaerobic sulfite reductase subunit A [Desulfonispora thiosulfatigenes DSM 11270]|uniref:Anaerobic sulfite reductase subunit A n=1 Tax=Desulfonispora thiosulfatigenes DSM 11270 TaxID=656914 RepID=A0A1W1VAJ4_DESTI|nr:anaerobic sulfite reductase subunit AsrA [Desulfonispora thiosulfatigenes]SMB90335.1 anaerobic sulfite reductase subunit A [Desulfonispora thiosulfatigenes DSM 11270]